MTTGTIDRTSLLAAGERSVQASLLDNLATRCDSASRHLYAAGMALAGVHRPVAPGDRNPLIPIRSALDTALRDLQDCVELVDELRSRDERCAVRHGGVGDPWQC